MEVRFSPDLEAKVADTAAREGRNPDEFVQEVVARYFEEERRLIDAVARGDVALDAGEYLTHEQVGRRLERFLRP
jgi:predicted transcriptional regulator